MSESFAELFEQSIANESIRAGGLVTGTVIDIHNGFVLVTAGLKSEAFIPEAEFKNPDGELQINIGDEVEVVLESLEDGFGETRLSHEKAKRAKAWDRLEKVLEDEEIITGIITGKVKGGFTVDLGDIRAFLPGSLVDVRPVRDTAFLEGKDLEFKVIKLDQRRNNVVVSRRAVVEQEYSAEREELLKNLQEGSTVKGLVKNLTDYGAFIDLGGVDGLLHITDMAWKRVKHPSEVVTLGDEIEVKVLSFDREKNRVSLGLKQMGQDPWEGVADKYNVGSKLTGKVTNITDYGCFIGIEEGIEGLVHVSEMDWTNKNANPNKVVTVGQEVNVMVLELDAERRRISLGMKQCVENPWDAFSSNFAKGDKVKGNIKSITDFGVFIGLDGGIDGLIHLSDLSWNEAGEEAIHNYKKGDEVEAVILAIDSERERISLGLKQMAQDPVSNFIADNPKGSIVKGKIVEVEEKFATVELAEEVLGSIRISDVSSERIDSVSDALNVGDEIEAKFVGYDRKNRSINLSIRAKDQDEENATIDEYKASNTSTGGTLGDLLKEQLDNN